MANIIDGTTGNDVLTGTAGDDIINGLAGDDIITGGLGSDTMFGGDGDDTFIQDHFTFGIDNFDGGNGFDTLELGVTPEKAFSDFGPLSFHIFNLPFTGAGISSITSIERLRFAGSASEKILAQFGYDQFSASGITEVVGSAGKDILAIQVAAAGIYSLPVFTLTDWSSAPTNAWESTGDIINLNANTAGNVTLNASAGINALQWLNGGGGDDIINGSDNADILNGNGGANQLHGGDGNDSLAIVNDVFSLPNNGAGSLFDGGTGTDVLTIGGYVNFAGTLQSIEGVNLLPASDPGYPIGQVRFPAVLEIDSAHLAMLPLDAFFTGTGTVIVNLADATNFDASLYTLTAGSNVSFHIYGGIGDGISLTGAANEDLIKFGTGVQAATGGGGADLFQVGAGTGTVTDFTLGSDRIDLSVTGITGPERLGDFLSQGPGGAQIAGDSGGVHREIVLSGIAASSLTPSDFIYNPGNVSVFDPGTPFNDVLFGFRFNDQLFGGDGDDRIYTGGGGDMVITGAGNDTVVVDGYIDFGSTFDGGADSDTLLVRPGATTSFPGLAPFVAMFFANVTNFETLRFGSLPGSDIILVVSTYQASEFSTIVGGSGVDNFAILADGSASNTYTIPVLNLVDWSATDLVTLAVAVFAPPTDNTLNSVAHSGTYVLSGAGGNDTLNGTSSNENLLGEAGNDTFYSGGGIDKIDGGIGTDTAVFAGNRSSHTVSSSPDGSVLIDSTSVTNVELFRFDDGNYTWNGTQLVPDNHPPVANADNASVNEDASVTGNILSNDNNGESSPLSTDTISLVAFAGQAVSGATLIQGAYGTLSINASGAYSYVANADVLDALPSGALLTESFDYSISDSYGASATSTLTLNITTIADLVTVTLGNRDNRFNGTGADEIVTGGRSNDFLYGNAGSDRLYGGLGEDKLYGGDGWDLLVGGKGEDRLYGGNGNDVLIGGKGEDLLFGGLGADVFEFGRNDRERDRIGDFELGVDKLHLSDGVTITGTLLAHGSTFVSLSSGGSIELVSVTGIGSVATLLTPELPHWTDGLLLA
jgi:VCBS repeat-containing protein